MRRITIVLAVVLVAGLIAPVAASNATDGTQSDGFTLQELRQGGQEVPEIHPGWRPLESITGAAWIQHYPSGGLVNTDQGSGDFRYLRPGTKVERNFVDLTVMSLGSQSRDNVTLNVVYWQSGEREVVEGNQTVTRQVPTNVTHDTKRISLGGTGTTERINLRPEYGTAQEVTMWLESSSETARWRFTYEPLPTSKAANQDTVGEMVMWGFITFIVPSLIASLIGGVIAEIANRIAVRGPRKGYIAWSFGLLISTIVILTAAWTTLANVLVAAPWILSIVIGLVVFIVRIEGERDVETWEIKRPIIDLAETATGRDGVESRGSETKFLAIAEDNNGDYVHVPRGLKAWIKRLAGARTWIRFTTDPKNMERDRGGTVDWTLWVDPLSGDLFQKKEPARWTLGIPSKAVFALAIGIGLVAAAALSAMGASTMLAIGPMALTTIVGGIRATDGEYIVDPAPAHMGDAYATTMVLAGEYAGVKTVDQANETVIQERTKRQVDAQQAIGQRDRTLVQEVHEYDGDDEIGELDDLGDLEERLQEALSENGEAESVDDVDSLRKAVFGEKGDDNV